MDFNSEAKHCSEFLEIYQNMHRCIEYMSLISLISNITCWDLYSITELQTQISKLVDYHNQLSTKYPNLL
jgi:hypothetical protein